MKEKKKKRDVENEINSKKLPLYLKKSQVIELESELKKSNVFSKIIVLEDRYIDVGHFYKKIIRFNEIL